MIIASDLHLTEDTEDLVLGVILPELCTAALQNDSELAILGDVLHIRYKIDARIQNRLMDVLRTITDAGVKIRILPGNHDQYDVAGRNALEPLNEMRHVRVYTEPTADGDGVWLPYRKDATVIQKLAVEMLPRAMNVAGVRVAFMHHGIQGARMNDGYPDESGVVATSFRDYDRVFCGHYHKRQTIANVVYVGSPYQTKADEAGQDKGFVRWSGEKFEYDTRSWGRRFHSITVQPGQSLDLTGVAIGDEVRVQTAAGVDPEKIGDQLIKAGIANHVVTPDPEPLTQRLNVDANAGLRQFAEAYAQAQDTHLDKGRLLAVFAEISGS